MFWIITGAIVSAFGIAVVMAAASSGKDPAVSTETRPVEIRGGPLAKYDRQDPSSDPAVGLTAPTVVGSDFDGKRVEIANDGKPKAIAFVAHWCPHCRAEVPRLAVWLRDHDLPPNLELIIVPTSTDPSSPNYPPSTWLHDAGLGSISTLVDDAKSDTLQAFGTGGFPYWVYLDSRSKVVARTSGEYPDNPDVYASIFDAVARGEPFPSTSG